MPGAANWQAVINGWELALANDAANPQPSYNINGKQVSNAEWRANLTEQLANAYKMLNQATPYIQRTIKRM